MRLFKSAKKYIVFTVYFVILITVLMSIYRSDSMKSPEKLLETPVYNEKYSNYFDEVKNFTSIDTNFVLPKNIKNTGGISLVDLDNDKSKELVVFKKKSLDSQGSNTILMYVFKMDEDGRIIDEKESVETIQGDSINFADFVDINGDGKKEIVLDISGKISKKLYVFGYASNSIKQLYLGRQKEVDSSILASCKFGTEKHHILFFDMSGSSEDIKDEGKNVIIYSLVYEDGEYSMNPVITKSFSSKVSKVEVHSGKVSKNQNGMVVSYFTDDGDKITSIITMHDGQFRQWGNWLSGHNESSDNGYFYPLDLNDDDILDIPIMDTSASYSLPKNCKIVNWYNWNGSDEGDLKFINQTLYAIDSNLKFRIPENLIGHIDVSKKKDIMSTVYEFSVGDKTIDDVVLFTITVSPLSSENYDTKSKENTDDNVILHNQNTVYRLEIRNIDYAKRYNITFDKLKARFGYINN